MEFYRAHPTKDPVSQKEISSLLRYSEIQEAVTPNTPLPIPQELVGELTAPHATEEEPRYTVEVTPIEPEIEEGIVPFEKAFPGRAWII